MAEVIKKFLLGKVVFWVCLAISIIFLVLGFILPPTGQIDPSVLQGVGELFAFATLATVADAIKQGYDAKISHGNTSVEINND